MDYNSDRALLAGALKQVDDGFKTILDSLISNGLYEVSCLYIYIYMCECFLFSNRE